MGMSRRCKLCIPQKACYMQIGALLAASANLKTAAFVQWWGLVAGWRARDAWSIIKMERCWRCWISPLDIWTGMPAWGASASTIAAWRIGGISMPEQTLKRASEWTARWKRAHKDTRLVWLVVSSIHLCSLQPITNANTRHLHGNNWQSGRSWK